MKSTSLRNPKIASAAQRIFVVIAAVCLSTAAAQPREDSDNGRVRLAPHFAAGQVVRYQIEVRNVSQGHTDGPIRDPEAASQLKQSMTVVIRLEVLRIDPQPRTNLSKVRMRATYEHSTATNESDAYDEQADAIAQQLRKLEGQSMEFTLESDGRISELRGLDKVLQDPSAIANARGWLSNISIAAGFPKKGIAIGEKWHSEEPLSGAPLKGTVWRADSTYLRNEPCRAEGGATKAATGMPAPATATSDAEMCAVVLTQFKIMQTNSHGDLTPPDYLQNGLHTSGSWTGSGDSLNSISLRSGLVVSVTQTSDQLMNFTISSSSSPSKLNYTGEVKSQSQIALLPASDDAAR
jgi:hypothetical protein